MTFTAGNAGGSPGPEIGRPDEAIAAALPHMQPGLPLALETARASLAAVQERLAVLIEQRTRLADEVRDLRVQIDRLERMIHAATNVRVAPRPEGNGDE